ncbi:MAG: hypothetical protein ACRDGQ_14960, partial [Candidatus Limnocylindrales bacterium]
MAEIITESFCERCGTRYTFEAATPKKRRIGKLRVLSKGLKNYVLSDDASLDEALAEARSDDERERSGGQLDAFHQTFQFCMSCRQYTCANCWNETEGRCLSCAPMAVTGSLLRSPLDDLLAGGGMAPLIVEPDVTEVGTGEPNGHNGSNGHNGLNDVETTPAAITGSAWPTIDLFRIPDVPPAAFERTEGQIVPASPTEEVASGETTTHLDADATLETGPTTETGAAPEAELSSAAEFWMRPFTGFAPGPEATNGHDHADAKLAEPEPEAEPEAVSAAEPAAEPEPEAVSAAEPEPEPEAVSAADDRAEELAGHTARLLGRFRVPDPSGRTPTPAATAETLATAAKRRVTAEPVQAEPPTTVPLQAEPVQAEPV